MERILWLALAAAIVAASMGWVAEARSPSAREMTLVSRMATRLSVTVDGAPANGGSWSPAISDDGRFVAFHSSASNLVRGDTNRRDDVFVYDRRDGQLTRVSVASDGTEGNGHSWGPSISDDGRFAAFASRASNLVANDTNDRDDVFVRDRQTGVTTRISVTTGGEQGNGRSAMPTISADGRYVAFVSSADNLVPFDTNRQADVFVHDRHTTETTRVSVATDGTEANGESGYPSISADGRYVAFVSSADNLVPGDTNREADVFVHDRQSGRTTRVSLATDGRQANRGSSHPSISADGEVVAFTSFASNLVSDDTNWWPDVFVHNRQSGETMRVSVATDGTEAKGESGYPSISADGRYVAFTSMAGNLAPGVANPARKVFVHDRQAGVTTRVSAAGSTARAEGPSWQPAISADGRYVAFTSWAGNPAPGATNGIGDVFVHDRQPAVANQMTAAKDRHTGHGVWHSQSSADGRYLAFCSPGGNVVPDDTNGAWDVFVYDRQRKQTTRISVSSEGTEGNGPSRNPSISADGRYVAFTSWASDLVPDDTNKAWDVFVHDRDTGETTRVSVASDGTEANGDSWSLGISADGRYVVFQSYAGNLAPGLLDSPPELFIHDRQTGITTPVSH
jgi:Tol biopolymer transport system component